jgi:hypothetical protein
MLLVLIIISTCFFVFRRSNIEHFTFDEVLDKKCREITVGDVKNDYKWGGTGQCQKTQEQCNDLRVTCLNTGSSSVKVQDGIGGCRDPDDCATIKCNPEYCYTIACDDNNWCAESEEVNTAGSCENGSLCKPSVECDVDEYDRWKIVNGKWKKYKTKMNYHNSSGNCVRKYLDGSLWVEIPYDDDSFKDHKSNCSIGNITLGDTTQFYEDNGDIVCSNNPSLKWPDVTDYDNARTDEFNNRLERDGASIDLYHTSEVGCTLNNVDAQNYTRYCPEPDILDSFSEITNCYSADGKRLHGKDGESGTMYTVLNSDYTLHTPSTCYNKCTSFDTTSSSSPATSYTYTMDDCPNIDTSCAAACLHNAAGPYHEVVSGVQCHCKNFTVVTATTSNCYKLEDYENYDDRVCISNNNLFEYSDETCTNKPIICFDPLGDGVGTTPGFEKISQDPADSCYELSGGPQDIYFRYTPGRDAGGNEGDTWDETPASMIRDDNSCAPQILNTPTFTISEVEKTSNSITVSVTMPVGNTNTLFPYTRLMYINSSSGESFTGLALPENSLYETTATNTIYGNHNEGYINVVGDNSVTFENLLPETQYKFQIVTVYDYDQNNNVYSDQLEITTSIAPTQPEACEYSIDHGKQFQGRISSHQGKTVEECKTLCNENPECIGFNKRSTPTTSTCYLTTVDQPEPSRTYWNFTTKRIQWYDSTEMAYKKIYTGSCEPPQQEPAAPSVPEIPASSSSTPESGACGNSILVESPTFTASRSPTSYARLSFQMDWGAHCDDSTVDKWELRYRLANGYSNSIRLGSAVATYTIDISKDAWFWIVKMSEGEDVDTSSEQYVEYVVADGDCVEYLGPWTVCSGGTQSQTRRINRQKSGNGTPCTPEADLTRTCTDLSTIDDSSWVYTKQPNSVIWASYNQNIPEYENGYLANLDECKTLCNSLDECVGFNMDKAETKCYLKNDFANAESYPNYDLYRKVPTLVVPRMDSVTIDPETNYITIDLAWNTQEDSYYEIDEYQVRYRSIGLGETNSKTLNEREFAGSLGGRLTMENPTPMTWPHGDVDFWLVKRSSRGTDEAESSISTVYIGERNGRSCTFDIDCTSRDCVWQRQGFRAWSTCE